MQGVSVVVCTHNGAARLPRTLSCLRSQRVPPELAWEVIVVDNASTDASTDVARAVWGDGPAPLRVVSEQRIGLVHANHRGLAEARYDVVSLVNDDNAVAEDWVSRVADLMSAHPQAGAVGGRGQADAEGPLPAWFGRFERHYAVGPQAQAEGPLAGDGAALWGAGIALRKTAWLELRTRGFEPLAVGRQGGGLGAGEDFELCHALRLAGWQLHYTPRLNFRHVLPAERLRWSYLRRLHRGFGAASVALDPYLRAERARSASERWGCAWLGEALEAAARLLRFTHHALLGRWLEGDPAVLRSDQLAGRLAELLRWRGHYDRSLAAVRVADWRAAARP